MPTPGEITLLLRRHGQGDTSAADELFPLLYAELRRVARACMAPERAGHTLQPTALVREAWVRLAGAEGLEARDREHFLSLAARVMRRVLVEHARARSAEKRGGRAERVPLDVLLEAYESRALDLLALDEALTRLGTTDLELARLAELRLFGGLSNGEAGRALGLPLRSAERAWATARAWLRGALAEPT